MSEFDFDVEPVNEPRIDGLLLAIQISMKICTFIIQPLINTFQKIQMCGGALKRRGND